MKCAEHFQFIGSVTRGRHYISNASSILLFNILHVFDLIKMMYYEC